MDVNSRLLKGVELLDKEVIQRVNEEKIKRYHLIYSITFERTVS